MLLFQKIFLLENFQLVFCAYFSWTYVICFFHQCVQ